MIESVTIVGMGALGILYGNALVKHLGADRVRFLADGERLARYRQAEVLCHGEKCAFHITDSREEPAQLLIFAVKGPALEEAMALAAPCVGEDTVILSVLNGVTSEEALSQAFGPEKVIYGVAQGMDAMRQGTSLTYTHPGILFLGLPEEDYFDRGDKLEAVYQLFQQAGVDVRKEANILHRMWCKFMLNVGINQACMVFECNYGGVQQPGRPREVMLGAMREAQKLAKLEGYPISEEEFDGWVALADSLAPGGKPSMRQDGEAHRKSEVELFAGTMVRLGRKHGVEVPVNAWLYEKVKEMEAAY